MDNQDFKRSLIIFAQTKLVPARDIRIAVVYWFLFKKEITLFLNLYLFYLFWSCDLQDLGSSTGDRNHAPCNGRAEP